MLLKLEKITKSFSKDRIILDQLDLEVDAGERIAIVGPSGSGKTTLLNLIGTLDRPDSGKMHFEEQDLSVFSDQQLAGFRNEKIGFVFQAFNLLPRATVVRNVSLPLIYAGISKKEREEKAREALVSAGFDKERFYNLSNQLSGGQMQRVAIARALVNDPTLILADEPTGNLDTKTGDIVLETFQKLNDAGKTIVLITHEPYVAEHAERIIHIKDGVILEDKKNNHKIIIK